MRDFSKAHQVQSWHWLCGQSVPHWVHGAGTLSVLGMVTGPKLIFEVTGKCQSCNARSCCGLCSVALVAVRQTPVMTLHQALAVSVFPPSRCTAGQSFQCGSSPRRLSGRGGAHPSSSHGAAAATWPEPLCSGAQQVTPGSWLGWSSQPCSPGRGTWPSRPGGSLGAFLSILSAE